MTRRRPRYADEQRDRRFPEVPSGTRLAETLERMSALEVGGTNLSASLGVPGESGWVKAAGLADAGGPLDELLWRVGREYETDDRAVMGSLFLRGYLWRILLSAVAAFLVDRRSPDLGAENLALRFDENGRASGLALVGGHFAALPDDQAAGHAEAHVLSSEDELLGWMRDRLAEAHLPNLYAALRRSRPRRGTRALWGLAADVCAEAFMFVGQELGRGTEALGFAERLLAGSSPLSGPTNYYVLEHEGGLLTTRVRNTCCLYYRLGYGACSTCPRTSDEERLRWLVER